MTQPITLEQRQVLLAVVRDEAVDDLDLYRDEILALDAALTKAEEERDEARGCKPDAWEHLKSSERMHYERAERAIAAVMTAEAEREACAKLIEAWHNDPVNGHASWEWCACEDHAAAIRSRGDVK